MPPAPETAAPSGAAARPPRPGGAGPVPVRAGSAGAGAAGAVPPWGVDRAAFAVALATRLRRAGVPAGPTAVANLTRALACCPPDSRGRLYWAARVCLVRRHEEIEAFDAVFAAVFGGTRRPAHPDRNPPPSPPPGVDEDVLAPLPARTAPPRREPGLPWATLPPVVDEATGGDEADVAVPELLPSDLRRLAEQPFEELDPARMAQLGRWLAEAAARWPTRRSRRYRPASRGQRIGLRATLARARRTGFEPVRLVRVRPVRRPRRVVLLCDVSQSMRAQVPAYLHLMRALAVVADAEVFAFATGLTRLTPVLAVRSDRAAVEHASAKVDDRFGGTRIAANLSALLASHHGNALRGAVVVLASDGWDSDPATDLAAAMRRLRRRAYRVVWLNPRAAAPGFQPRVAAMAAALPYCDALLPADTFASLYRAVRAISDG
jgi:uncharacterized protein with von Willebrand factor type A (vWA) domain